LPDANLSRMGLRFYHTGATTREGWQPDSAVSLGGMKSVNECTGLVVLRADNAIYGLHIEAGHVETPGAKFIINCPTVDTVQIEEDGDAAYGTAVTITNGDTRVVMCADELQWLKITRLSANDLRGTEAVRVVAQYNAVVGGNNLITEDATDYTYSGVILKNEGTSNYTDVRVYSKSTLLAVRQEAVDGNGDIQSIVDEFTAPAGIDFATGWPTGVGTGLSINASATIGMWIRRAHGATIDSKIPCDLVMAYTVSGDVQQTSMHAFVARGKESYAEYELFIAEDPALPVFTDPPADTAATLAGLSYVVEASHNYNYEILYRNKFGLIALQRGTDLLMLDADFGLLVNPPADPVAITLSTRSDGALVLAGLYIAATDGAYPADYWRMYITYDGTAPDPDVDVPVAQAMGGNCVLEYVIAADLEDTPVKVIVKTYRSSDTTESVDETVYSQTMDYTWPFGSRPVVSGGLAFAKRAVVQDVQTTYVDVAKNIRWVYEGAGWTLYADTTALFALSEDGISAYCDFGDDPQTGAGTDDALEVGTWDGGEKTLWVNVAGAHVMKIDCINKVIYCATREDADLTLIHDRPAPYQIWPCYAYTVFNAYDPITDRWASIASIDSAGVFTCGVDWKDYTA
jgi:hypothetical protein